MPVDKEINLDNPEGITTEDIEIMEREADRLEEIAKNAERNSEKIDKAVEKTKGLSFAQLNIIDKSLDEGGMGGGVSMEQLLDFKIEMLEEFEKAKKERKENKKNISEEEKKRKEAIKKVRERTGDINEVEGAISGFRTNPFGFAKGKALGMLGKLGVYGLIASFVVEQAQQVYDQVLAEVKSQFKAGGAWDKRKIVLDVINEYNSIEYLTKIKSGGVFFTADAGQDLRQGAPRGANNTRDLRDGHLRFLQFHAGI